jgi:diadenylate cyclase
MYVIFENIFTNFRIVDCIDIALVSVIIYFLAVWTIESSSRYLVGGAFVVFALYVAGNAFDLYLTSLLFNGIVTILAFSLVVLFQEEIRRVFERISRLRIFDKGSDKSIDAKVDMIIESLSILASQRAGALIVLGGRDPLERHIETGVYLGGKVSKPLILSLFDPNTPGHDGAMVIEHGHVTKFAAHLPLSKNRKEVGERGTRHSAAIGLSEKCDAMVLVVSEESGQVSYARAGRLMIDLSPAELKTVIEKYISEQLPNRSSKTLWQLVTERLGLKMSSIFVACMAWLAVIYQPGKVLRTLEIPVESAILGQDMVVEKIVPEKVSVTFLGMAGSINLMEPSKVRIQLPLDTLTEGDHRISLKPDHIDHPANVSVFEIKPGFVSAKVLKFAEREIEIQPRLRGSIDDRYQIRSVDVSPSSVRAMVLNPNESERARITTTAVDIEGLSATKTFEANLEIPRFVKVQNADDLEVKVTVRIEPRRTRP